MDWNSDSKIETLSDFYKKHRKIDELGLTKSQYKTLVISHSKMKIALFFGSFNPIHTGHLIVAQVIAEQTDTDKVWFVISPQNPFKKKSSLLHEFDRLDMVRTAINDNSNFDASDIEFRMSKPSFTIDTLARLQDKYPQHEFRLIIGGDNLKHFQKWKNHEKILEFFGLYVYPRPNMDYNSPFLEHPNVEIIKAPLLDISATFIRNALQNNQSIKYLVPDEVEALIRLKKYYL